jgi:hypothetical protein
MNSTSDLFSQMTQRILQNGNLYVEFMNTVLAATRTTLARDGSDQKLNEIRDKLSQHLLALYQESVGKYLAAPQLGIAREALQQMNNAITAYHQFLVETGEFSIVFGAPLKTSMEILQQAIKEREGTDEEFKSAQEVYNFALKIFDREYDDWLKSPEGVRSVVSLVDKYLDYRKQLNPARDGWFKSLSIPTQREMEDVYRGIYDLKKKSRQQAAVIRKQTDTIKRLNQKVRKLEAFVAESLPKKTATSRSAQTKKKTGKNI